MFKYPCGSLCIDLWEAPAKYGLQWKMMQVSRIQWAWQHLIQALILCGVKQHSQVYRCGHSNSHEWRWRWHFFFVVMHWMSMFRWEGRRARDENTVRVKDGERKEGWRELGEILERTEGRLYFISFKLFVLQDGRVLWKTLYEFVTFFQPFLSAACFTYGVITLDKWNNRRVVTFLNNMWQS